MGLIIFLVVSDSVKTPICDSWIGEDKLYHFVVSSFMTGAFYHLFYCKMNLKHSKAVYFSVGTVISTGIFKELWDKKKGRFFSYKDMVFNLAGITAGYFIFMR